MTFSSHRVLYPQDELYVENAILLTPRPGRRYPLIIDPTGHAVAFVLRHWAILNVARTSFLADGFQKGVESALRFGVPLLVQDAEHADPLLNGVLNRQTRRAGGRVLVQLGDLEVDCSPAFTLFLSTREADFQFGGLCELNRQPI